MKIIYMGTPAFAVPPLKAIMAAGHPVLAVVTQPDKPSGRKREIRPSPVKTYALEQDIDVLQPQKLKSTEAIHELKKYAADIYVVAAYGQILSEEILNMPPFGCINIHASLLPRHRGAAPIQRAIMEGAIDTGVTIIQMDKGIDTGDMIFSEAVRLDERETADSLSEKLSLLGARLVCEALAQIEAQTVTARRQEESLATYAPLLRAEEGQIDWRLPAPHIERLLRGLYPKPGAYTYYQGKILKIWSAELVGEAEEAKAPPGTMVACEKNGIVVACGAGSIKIGELQAAGKKRMTAAAFLAGHKMVVGERLG